MKIFRGLCFLALLLALSGFSACGGSGGSDDDTGEGLSEDEAVVLSEQLANVATDAMNSGDYSAMEVVAPSEGLKSVQCNEDGSSCTFNVPIDYGVNCSTGGRIAVTGSLTGGITNGSGILQISAVETISDWQCITGYIINGDPYISMTGTFSFMNYAPSTQQSMRITGGFKWGTSAEESCQIYLSIEFDTGGGGNMSGTVCGYSIDSNF